jgi:DNA-binding GntR family transcriptional regulator
MTMEDVQELFQIREALEGVVARLAVESLNEAQMTLLEKNCVRLAKQKQGDDSQGVFETAREFHWLLLRGVHNRRIQEILANIRDQLSVVRKYLLNNPDKLTADLQDHPRILTAIRRQDADAAEQIMRRHIRATRSALAGALR